LRGVRGSAAAPATVVGLAGLARGRNSSGRPVTDSLAGMPIADSAEAAGAFPGLASQHAAERRAVVVVAVEHLAGMSWREQLTKDCELCSAV
jgi:hypothetical protein